MAEDDITLSHQEALHLVLSLLDGVEAIEEGHPVRESWTPEMRDWMDLILSRMQGGGA
jgi:hypothetical protein